MMFLWSGKEKCVGGVFMIYGYARVSTNGQMRDGNSLEAQSEALRANGAETIYSEAYTGTKSDRPKFEELLSVLKDGDTLVATKLDRISRSASQGIELVDSLTEKGVKIHILNLGMMDNTPSGKLVRNIFFAFAEFERDMIVERTREGKEIAKQKADYREGRKPLEIDREKYIECVEKNRSGEMSVTECCKVLAISRSSWYNLNRKAI